MIENDLMWTEFAQRIKKKRFRTTVGSSWSMNLKLGTIEACLANCDEVLATWLR